MTVYEDFFAETGTGIADGDFSPAFSVASDGGSHFGVRVEGNLVGLTSITFLLWASFNGTEKFPFYRTTEEGLNKYVQVGPITSNLFLPMATYFGWGSGPVAGPTPPPGESPFGVDITAWPIPTPMKGWPYLFFQLKKLGTPLASDSYSLSLATASY